MTIRFPFFFLTIRRSRAYNVFAFRVLSITRLVRLRPIQDGVKLDPSEVGSVRTDCESVEMVTPVRSYLFSFSDYMVEGRV